MHGSASLDLRWPIGLLFVVLGATLMGHGIATRENLALYARAGGLNVNLIWGAVMFVVGCAFALAARQGARRARDSAR
jgi:predicted phage tail protein